MPTYRVLYRPETDLLPELVDADRVDVECELWVVFRRMVTVIGQPREVVVRRLPAAPIADTGNVDGGVRLPATPESVAVFRASHEAPEEGQLLSGTTSLTLGSATQSGLSSPPTLLGDDPGEDVAYHELPAEIDHPAQGG